MKYFLKAIVVTLSLPSTNATTRFNKNGAYCRNIELSEVCVRISAIGLKRTYRRNIEAEQYSGVPIRRFPTDLH